ncbi:hypothetical protein FQZ97_1038880 [compost metagenome]
MQAFDPGLPCELLHLADHQATEPAFSVPRNNQDRAQQRIRSIHLQACITNVLPFELEGIEDPARKGGVFAW